MTEQELLQLEKRVDLLKEWKRNFMIQRFKFPLDYETRNIIKQNNITATGNTYENQNPNLSDFIGQGIIVEIKNYTKPGYIKTLYAAAPFYEFSVDPSSNIFSYDFGSFYVRNDDIIHVMTSGTLPAPLSSVFDYYIINATVNTFKVSITQGGSAVDVTTIGAGVHYFSKQQ